MGSSATGGEAVVTHMGGIVVAGDLSPAHVAVLDPKAVQAVATVLHQRPTGPRCAGPTFHAGAYGDVGGAHLAQQSSAGITRLLVLRAGGRRGSTGGSRNE
ncbi:MAG: hypothetical protein KY454_12995, partial [Actinobacteria bacterium]|nr:hypothetical protein [Actinomycetota bacterium]